MANTYTRCVGRSCITLFFVASVAATVFAFIDLAVAVIIFSIAGFFCGDNLAFADVPDSIDTGLGSCCACAFAVGAFGAVVARSGGFVFTAPFFALAAFTDFTRAAIRAGLAGFGFNFVDAFPALTGLVRRTIPVFLTGSGS